MIKKKKTWVIVIAVVQMQVPNYHTKIKIILGLFGWLKVTFILGFVLDLVCKEFLLIFFFFWISKFYKKSVEGCNPSP
jgi:hypothetical protein